MSASRPQLTRRGSHETSLVEGSRDLAETKVLNDQLSDRLLKWTAGLSLSSGQDPAPEASNDQYLRNSGRYRGAPAYTGFPETRSNKLRRDGNGPVFIKRGNCGDRALNLSEAHRRCSTTKWTERGRQLEAAS